LAGRWRSAASQRLCAAHWGPPPDERCAWDATVRKSPGTWRKGMRAASSENRDPRTRENRGRKRSPTVSKIRTNSDQSKLSHTSQFTVIECPFACPIPYIYVLHPASTTPRISPTMHYALRTHSLQYLHFLHYLHYLHCHSYLHYTLPPVNAYRSWRWPRTATACTHQQSMPSAFGGIVRLPLEADRFRCKLVLPAGSATEPADSIDAERLRSLVSQKPL
jgi:hypothetical protein